MDSFSADWYVVRTAGCAQSQKCEERCSSAESSSLLYCGMCCMGTDLRYAVAQPRFGFTHVETVGEPCRNRSLYPPCRFTFFASVWNRHANHWASLMLTERYPDAKWTKPFIATGQLCSDALRCPCGYRHGPVWRHLGSRDIKHSRLLSEVPLYFVYARSYSLIFGESDLSADR